MTEGGLALPQGREGGAQDPQLIDEMTDLQALIVIFCRLPVAARRLVLQGIAEGFLGVEPFGFDLPTQAPGGAEPDDRGGGDGEVGQVNEAGDGLLTALKVTDRLETVEPLEPMAVIVDVGDPRKRLLDQLRASDAPLVTVLARAERTQCLHFLPDAGEVAVLEGQEKGPVVGAAGIEKALVGIEPVGGQTDRQARVELLERGRQAPERLALASLFLILAHRVGDPLRGQRNGKAVGGDQFGLQPVMKVSGFAGLRGLMQALFAMRVGTAHRAGGVDGHHKILAQQAVFVQRFLLQQGFHQPLLEPLQRLVRQPTQHPVHRVQVRQPELRGCWKIPWRAS